MKGDRRYIQGYNAQAGVERATDRARREISRQPDRRSQLRPMLETAIDELRQVGVTDKPTVVVADAQYWNEQHIDDVVAERGCQVLIPPDGGKRQGERPGWTGGRYAFMRRVLASDAGKQLYRKRQQSIEPVFGHAKQRPARSTASTDRGRSLRQDRVAARDAHPRPSTEPTATRSH